MVVDALSRQDPIIDQTRKEEKERDKKKEGRSHRSSRCVDAAVLVIRTTTGGGEMR